MSGQKETKMLDVNIFHNKILYLKNILPNSLDLIDLIESTDDLIRPNEAISKWDIWKASGNSGYVFGKKKQSNRNYLNRSQEGVQCIYNEIYSLIDKSFKLYKDNIEKNIGTFDEFGIGKYYTGSGMGKHVDVDPSRQNFKETVSGILYLNDDYLGGEIFFEDHHLLIKPEAGSMIIFPSTTPFFHESKPIEKGVKYICTAFCSI